MIYTVTFSPAIDYVVHMDSFKPGATNRTVGEEYYFGGKGINVSMVLKELGISSTALGFVSGFTGKALRDGLAEKGLSTDFIELSNGFTRINVKIKGELETEINGQGPKIDKEAVEALFGKLDRLTGDDVLVVSGSVPSSMPSGIYEQILERMEGKKILTVVDASGDLLLKVLRFHPFLIKPNRDELIEMLGGTYSTVEEITEGAKKLQEMGAQNVLVSMGKDGAVLVSAEGKVIRAEAILGKTVNSVGAGDSMVAGFLAGYREKQDYAYALKLGTAAGSATACSPGLATAEEIERRMQ